MRTSSDSLGRYTVQVVPNVIECKSRLLIPHYLINPKLNSFDVMIIMLSSF